MYNNDHIMYYYREIDELAKARQLFIERFPKLAPFLSNTSKDPDIERLIENFAILTSKIKMELDQNIPSIAESLINIIAPNYTSSIPSMCMQEFSLNSSSDVNNIIIPRGTDVFAKQIKNVSCHFTTVYDLYLYPIIISDVLIQSISKFQSMSLKVDSYKDGVNIADMNIGKLNLYLGNDIYVATTLLMWLFNYLHELIIINPETNEEYKVPIQNLSPVGFDDKDSIFAKRNTGIEAFALMQEYFFIPDKFNMVTIDNIDILKSFNTRSFILKFIFKKSLPSFCIPRADHFSFGISPIINLFEISTIPMKNDINKDGFRLSISKTHDKYYNILEVVSVFSSASVRGKRYLKNYNNFERFEFLREDDMPDFFTTSRKKDINGDEYTYLTLYDSSILMSNEQETLSINTICCNGNLPEELKIGDINIFDNKDISTTNITMPTKLYKVSVDGTILWRLVSVLSLNYQTMINRTSFLAVLHAYNFTLGESDNISEKLRDSIKDIKSKTVYRIINGIPKKGTLCIVDIDDSLYYCIGEVYRLGLVLAKFFSSFASINSFCELQVNCISTDIVLDYFPSDGRKANI